MASYSLAFAGDEHDLPGTADRRPDRSIIIAATPRSGSSLLADTLRTAGLGVPLEYLELNAAAPTIARRWGTDSVAEYLAVLLARRTTADGTFSIKVHWHQLIRFYRVLTGQDHHHGHDPIVAQMVAELFPNPTWLWLRRHDTLRQAISLYRAEHTGQYANLGDEQAAPPAPFDEGQIRQRQRQLDQWDADWGRFFGACPDRPYELTYEQLTDDPGRTLGDVLGHLGVDTPPAAPATRRQADPTTDAWVAALGGD